MTTYETFAGSSIGCLTLIDEFAEDRGTRGLMPAPLTPLRFTFIARQDQGNMVPLEEPIALVPQRGESGAYLFADDVRLGNRPRMRVAPGTYRLRIESDYYLAAETTLAWPLTPPFPAPLRLRPGYAYPFPDVTVPAMHLTLLRGSVVEAVTGAPVAGALVEMLDPPDVGQFNTTITDARGAWVLAVRLPAIPEEQLATVRISLPNGGAVIVVADVKMRPAGDNSLPQTALRGQVLTTTGSAVAGAEITLDTVPGESVRSGRDGAWAFYFGLNQPDGAAQVTAKAPDGQTQSQNVDVFNRKTMVVPTFRFAMN